MATALTSQYTRFTDKCNRVLAGGVVKTFEPNSLIPKITYQDPLATIPNLPEVVLDSTGRARIYLLGDYRVQIYSNDGTLIEDNLYVDQGVSQTEFLEVNKTLIANVDSLEDLEEISNVWDGRTIYVKDLGNYRYDALTTSWVKAYQDADNVKDGAETQKQINASILGDNGASVINLSFSSITNSVKKSLYNVVYDQIIDVTWFGAIGNWNMGSQTGFDSTQAVAKAIEFYSTLGTRRQGGRRAIKFPYGNFKLSTILVPASIDFGIDFIGDGQQSTYLWFDHTNTSPAIECLVEFVQFSDMTLMGSLSDQNGSNSALWKSVGFKGKLATNYPDIDVKFFNCGFYFFQDLSQIYGRGCVFDSCSIGFVLAAMNIVCDPDTVFNSSSYFTSLETGMRHYTFRNCRFDVVSRIYKITGSAAQKDHINDILCAGNDFSLCDILIEGPDATIRRTNINGNNAVYSFTTGIVQVKSSSSGQMTSCNWSKEFNDSVLPDANGDCINSLWKTTGGINGLVIANVTAKNISGNIVSAGTASSDVKIANNNFPQAWTFANGSTNHFVFYSAVNCDGLQILGNSFQTRAQNGSYFMYDAGVQTSHKTRVQGNTAPWTWQDHRLRFTPALLVNGTASTTPATSTYGKYYLDDTYVYTEVMIAINPVETSGDLAISLPAVSAVAENSNIASSYAGGGEVLRYAGFTATANTIVSAINVNPANQQAELYKVSNMTQSRITAADRSGSITLFLRFKYKY
ncbi:hypothetical protein ACOI3P_04010 [Acinetobacter baumannii]